jgi:hypothetical protein
MHANMRNEEDMWQHELLRLIIIAAGASSWHHRSSCLGPPRKAISIDQAGATASLHSSRSSCMVLVSVRGYDCCGNFLHSSQAANLDLVKKKSSEKSTILYYFMEYRRTTQFRGFETNRS